MINSIKKTILTCLISLMIVILSIGIIMPRYGAVNEKANRKLRESNLYRWHSLVEDYIKSEYSKENQTVDLYVVVKTMIKDPFYLDNTINLLIPPKVLWKYLSDYDYKNLLFKKEFFEQYCEYKLIFIDSQNWQIIETAYTNPGKYYLSIDQDKRIEKYKPNLELYNKNCNSY